MEVYFWLCNETTQSDSIFPCLFTFLLLMIIGSVLLNAWQRLAYSMPSVCERRLKVWSREGENVYVDQGGWCLPQHPSSLNHSSMTHSLTQGGPNFKQKPLHQLALGIGYCFFGEENEMMFMSRIPSAFSGLLIFCRFCCFC